MRFVPTPLSPLLANIGLHGLETFIMTTNQVKTKWSDIIYPVKVVRYADDFIVTAKEKGSLETAKIQIQQWLSERGLELSYEKTRITSIEEGFDFLGFNHRHYDGTILIKPSKQKVLDFCKRIGKEIKELNGYEPELVIKKLNPVLRGFTNYYKSQVSSEVFGYISHRLWNYLWKWALRRHPNKGKKWVIRKHFRTIKGKSWVFSCTSKDRRGNENILSIFSPVDTHIERHIKVKGTSSPDDPSLKDYWEKRNQKNGKSKWERNSRNYKIAQNQNWKCPICGEPLINGEELDTHHIIPVAQGGLDDLENLQHLHAACHRQEHSKSKFSRLK
ncbi:group II intron reverse transcriptase [Chamaesiphon polymorphus]|uniref:Reverse transcriptase domain-containing protein n=1 Tax=Chamaesiphon polymorphus CCALA 037 TaxID=2107692 RepID=A0A2T1GI89_9CYAN|nr:group II intron maturase-specific domain-containing protein [Chamaesiphon polymorphus]PSB57434.1 hypothetical protein C7B77_08480 [Chamaesiphon polymorphus CCALA 037]